MGDASRIKMKKIILSLIIGLFLISLASAGLIGPFKQGTDVNIIQTCDDCTYNNITSVLYPNGFIALSKVQMDKDGTYYNYTLTGNYTQISGTYIVNGVGDLHGVDTVWAYDFDITPTGTIQSSILNNPVLIILFLLSLIFLGLGVGFKIASLGFIGSILLILSGIYTMIYGFNNITNLYTRGVAIALIGLGIIFMFISAYEWLPWGKE